MCPNKDVKELAQTGPDFLDRCPLMKVKETRRRGWDLLRNIQLVLGVSTEGCVDRFEIVVDSGGEQLMITYV